MLITDRKDAITENNKLSKQTIRRELLDFQTQLIEVEGAIEGDSLLCPLKHSFSDGVYVREIFIPKGTVLVGKIHKHAHPNFLMSGTVDVITEEGKERMQGPRSMVSPAGTKRVVHAIEDTVWITVHHNPRNIKDLTKLEDIVIAKDYETYERFISLTHKSFTRKLLDKFLLWKNK